METPLLSIYCCLVYAEAERALQARIPVGISVACSHDCADEAEQLRNFLTADIVFGNPPLKWLEQADRLRWLQLESVGIDPYRNGADSLWSKRVVVTNLKAFFGPPVAETLVAGVLSLNRGLSQLADCKREVRWAHKEIRSSLRLLHGSSAIVLGAGSIGLHVKRILDGFGVSTAVYARTASIATLTSLEALDKTLPQVDVVFSCLPDTDETCRLFDDERLRRMRVGAVFVNGGRGSVVDEDALVGVLTTGHLSGAVLDVTQVEPLPAQHPFWTCPNIILTQHTGGGFVDEISAKVELFVSNLERFIAADSLRNVVELSANY